MIGEGSCGSIRLFKNLFDKVIWNGMGKNITPGLKMKLRGG